MLTSYPSQCISFGRHATSFHKRYKYRTKPSSLELCFWLFLTSVGSSQSQWFTSWHFRFWAVGSIAAMVGLPLTTWLTRSNPLNVRDEFKVAISRFLHYTNIISHGEHSVRGIYFSCWQLWEFANHFDLNSCRVSEIYAEPFGGFCSHCCQGLAD